MAITITWYDDAKTIIQHDFPVEWTWDEFYEAIRQSVEMEKTVTHDVYVLSVNPPNVKIPAGNAIQHFQKSFGMHRPHVRFVVVPINNMLVALFGRSLIRLGLVTKKVRVVHTIEEALGLIAADKEEQKEAL
jgi:hypothetical protein